MGMDNEDTLTLNLKEQKRKGRRKVKAKDSLRACEVGIEIETGESLGFLLLLPKSIGIWYWYWMVYFGREREFTRRARIVTLTMLAFETDMQNPMDAGDARVDRLLCGDDKRMRRMRRFGNRLAVTDNSN